MKKINIKQLIKEEFDTIKENAKKRWVATIDFYVQAENESFADQEVQQIMNMIDEQYDNHPSLVDLKPQQFGKIGMGEATDVTTQIPADLTNVTRLVVVNHNSNLKTDYGRVIDEGNLNSVKLDLQDDGRTLKIFIK